jgi:biopolymer transport protein ExbB
MHAKPVLGVAHFIQQADGVAIGILAILLFMSFCTWYLIVVKGIRTLQARTRSRRFLAGFWRAPNLDTVVQDVKQTGPNNPFSHLLHHGIGAIEQHRHSGSRGLIDAGTSEEFLTRALKRSIEDDKSRLEYGLSFLATVASTAPFVGLLGTVVGIYNALIAIGISGQGMLDKIAGPVGEALIMTGIGLAVAIPASIAYNAFARFNRNLLSQLNSFAHDLFAFLSTGMKTGQPDMSTQQSVELVARRAGE